MEGALTAPPVSINVHGVELFLGPRQVYEGTGCRQVILP